MNKELVDVVFTLGTFKELRVTVCAESNDDAIAKATDDIRDIFHDFSDEHWFEVKVLKSEVEWDAFFGVNV